MIRDYLPVVLTVMVGAYFIYMSNIVSHELTHENIYHRFGCPNTKIVIRPWELSGTTYCLDTKNYNFELGEMETANNEIVGYQIVPNLMGIQILLFAYIMIYVTKLRAEQKEKMQKNILQQGLIVGKHIGNKS